MRAIIRLHCFEIITDYYHNQMLLNNLDGTKYSRIDQVKFFVEGCLPQILLCQFLNTMPHMCDTILLFVFVIYVLFGKRYTLKTENCS